MLCPHSPRFTLSRYPEVAGRFTGHIFAEFESPEDPGCLTRSTFRQLFKELFQHKWMTRLSTLVHESDWMRARCRRRSTGDRSGADTNDEVSHKPSHLHLRLLI